MWQSDTYKTEEKNVKYCSLQLLIEGKRCTEKRVGTNQRDEALKICLCTRSWQEPCVSHGRWENRVSWGRKMEEMAGPMFGIVQVIIWTLASRLPALRFFPLFFRVWFFPFQEIKYSVFMDSVCQASRCWCHKPIYNILFMCYCKVNTPIIYQFGKYSEKEKNRAELLY